MAHVLETTRYKFCPRLYQTTDLRFLIHEIVLCCSKPHMLVDLNDNRFYSIYDVAREFDKAVFVHTGKAGSSGSLDNKEATHPNFLEEAIQLYAGVWFIVGHVGNRADFEGSLDP